MGDLIWVVFILIAIVNFFSSRKKKQQQEEAKRRAAAQAQQVEETPPAAYAKQQADPRFPELDGGYAKRQADPRFPDVDIHPSQRAQAADPRFPDSAPEAQQESAARRARQQAAEQELAAAKRAAQARLRSQQQAHPQQSQPMTARVATTLQPPMQSRLENPEGRRHTLEASFISGHAHTESSLTGIQEDCPPPRPAQASAARTPAPREQAPATPTGDALGKLMRDRGALVQGLLMSEVLGKPKALRR